MLVDDNNVESVGVGGWRECEQVGDHRSGPSISLADTSGLEVVGIVVDSVLGGFEIFNEFVGTDDDNDIGGGDERNDTSTRGIGNNYITCLSDTINGSDDVGSGGSDGAQHGNQLGEITSTLDQGLGMNVAPLSVVLRLQEINKSNLSLYYYH